MTGESDDRPIAALLKDVAGNLQHIIRGEVRLATLELGEQLGKATDAAIVITIGGVFAIAALGFVLLGAVDLLATVIARWQAAILVGGVAGAIGGALVAIGMRRLHLVALRPSRTFKAAQEKMPWVKAHAK